MRSVAFVGAFVIALTWSFAVQSADCQDARANSCRSDLSVTMQVELSTDLVLNCVRTEGHHIVMRESVCPIGGEKFQSAVLGTYSTRGVHLDLEPVSYLSFPTPVPVCPSNGFVIHKSDYSESDLKRYAKVISSDAYKKLYAEKHASFYLFSRFLDFAGDENKDRWWLLLKATWEADQCKSDKYVFYARETIEAAKARLSPLKPSDDQYWVLNLIIPNLYRRAGEFDQAQRWLDAFGDQKPVDEGAKAHYSLAFDLLRGAIAVKKTHQIKVVPPQRKK